MNEEKAVFEFQKGLGTFIKSPEDYRTVKVSNFVATAAILPSSFFVDVSKLPIWNQRALGACVGHGTAKNKQAADFKEDGTVGKHSPRFIYALCKATDGLLTEGTYPQLAMKVLKDYGCATELTVPNDTTLGHEEYVYGRDISRIPKEAFIEAEKYKIGSYAGVEFANEAKFKTAIMKCSGVILSVAVGSEWFTDVNGSYSMKASDVLPLRLPKSVTGYHLVYVYGWEDLPDGRTKYYIVNSWSEEWADMGKGYFLYDEYRKGMVESWAAVDLPNNWKEQIKTLPKKEEFKHSFSSRISKGDRGAEVVALQTAYKISGVWPENVPIVPSNIYGSVTQKATIAFMRKYAVAGEGEILAVNGLYVGPKTRAKLNELFNK